MEAERGQLTALSVEVKLILHQTTVVWINTDESDQFVFDNEG